MISRTTHFAHLVAISYKRSYSLMLQLDRALSTTLKDIPLIFLKITLWIDPDPLLHPRGDLNLTGADRLWPGADPLSILPLEELT